ncbi:hypothetical protein PYV02_09010 [Leifsonia sp. H3M29-4]|uniref:hypothetical protein n=1 Tax=Salinibacterium metalliresistens TaxID=3031321 RepID=UPI0023DB01A3|nr:hypothetical protein [Salinibacterium metalliresistens]MDF1479218.1 hypothetical protein [Salinibacterium metalliresistens]
MAAQEKTLPGSSLLDRHTAVLAAGFDGVEVSMPVDGPSRRTELVDAVASGPGARRGGTRARCGRGGRSTCRWRR